MEPDDWAAVHTGGVVAALVLSLVLAVASVIVSRENVHGVHRNTSAIADLRLELQSVRLMANRGSEHRKLFYDRIEPGAGEPEPLPLPNPLPPVPMKKPLRKKP